MTQNILTIETSKIPIVLNSLQIKDIIKLLNGLTDQGGKYIIDSEEARLDLSERKEIIFNILRFRANRMKTPAVREWIKRTHIQKMELGKNITTANMLNLERWQSILESELVRRGELSQENKGELKNWLNKEHKRKSF